VKYARSNFEVQGQCSFATFLLTPNKEIDMAKKRGLYDNINAKRARIKAGSGEKMRKPGSKGAPTAKAFKRSAKTAKKK
jgi:hypothetical protein